MLSCFFQIFAQVCCSCVCLVTESVVSYSVFRISQGVGKREKVPATVVFASSFRDFQTFASLIVERKTT